MADEILRELAPGLTLEQLQETLCAAERQLEGDDGRLTPSEVISFSQGTVEAREVNVATFKAREGPPLPLVLLDNIPTDSFEKELFFQSLGKRGFDLICYSDVLVRGKTTELVTCRLARPPAPENGGNTGVTGAGENAAPPAATPLVSQAAFDLIVEFEGLDQPGLWPGESSGISLGVGYDLAFVIAQQFGNDWGPHLTPTQIARLKTAIGKSGPTAKAIAPRFSDIKVNRVAAMEVFTRSTLPRFTKMALAAFPGMEKLPSNARGALVSLVFNRGPDVTGERRREMAEIRRIIKAADLPATLDTVLDQIAGQIKSMKRLWPNTRGLQRRRDAEAALVLSGARQAGGVIGAGPAPLNIIVPKPHATGEMLVEIAGKHTNVGEKYRLGALVPKNDRDYHGPWDCSEFISWCVFQTVGILYGCEDNGRNPAKADAWTGYWERDARRLGRMISVQEAAGIPGAVILRFPPSTGVGHIVLSDGRGGTLEAKGTAFGVVTDVIKGRRWNTGILIDGIAYQPPSGDVQFTPPVKVYFVGAVGMDRNVIEAIQEKLRSAEFDPGPTNGEFGDLTADAVLAFQMQNNLMVDGEVGPETAKALGVTL
jgi:N-acetylmuramoyl-L-alanine amidase